MILLPLVNVKLQFRGAVVDADAAAAVE